MSFCLAAFHIQTLYRHISLPPLILPVLSAQYLISLYDAETLVLVSSGCCSVGVSVLFVSGLRLQYTLLVQSCVSTASVWCRKGYTGFKVQYKHCSGTVCPAADVFPDCQLNYKSSFFFFCLSTVI